MNRFFIIGWGLLLGACWQAPKEKVASLPEGEQVSLSDHYVIEGKAPVREGARVFLYEYKNRSYLPVDSTALDEQGYFRFEGKAETPYIYALRLNGTGGRAHLYLENTHISLELNPDWNFNYLHASEQGQLFERYNRMAAHDMLDLPKEIKEAPDSPALAYFLARRASLYEYPELLQMRKALDPSLNTNPYIQELDAFIDHLSKIQPGMEAPQVDLQDVQGRKISLRDFRGKKLLIDFWASWCPDCRQASPKLVQLYKTYKNKGVEFLSISLDDNLDQWQKAIKKDQLTWSQALAKGAWKSDAATTYALRWIPTSFLLDERGFIIARSIHVEDLEKEMKK